MKQTVAGILLLLCIWSCQNNASQTAKHIEFIDSLEFSIGENRIKVALIDLSQKYNVRPYSSLFDDHLIVLNKQDSFYTFHSNNLQRDTVFEKRLNSQRFRKAFVISDILYGVDSCNLVYRFDGINNQWVKHDELPLFNSAPIYENDKYVCYSICNGEFGGLVFFYNKESGKITFAPATCSVSMIEHKSSFYIISNLAHLDEWSDIILVNNPDSLVELPNDSISYKNWDRVYKYLPILENADTSHYKQIIHVSSFSDKLITSGFRIKGKNYFLTKSYKKGYKTYFTRFEHDTLTIINSPDTILANLPASHGERTRKTNGNTVIDYTAFACDPIGWKESEYRNILLNTFIINDSSLIRINWLNNPNE